MFLSSIWLASPKRKTALLVSQWRIINRSLEGQDICLWTSSPADQRCGSINQPARLFKHRFKSPPFSTNRNKYVDCKGILLNTHGGARLCSGNNGILTTRNCLNIGVVFFENKQPRSFRRFQNEWPGGGFFQDFNVEGGENTRLGDESGGQGRWDPRTEEETAQMSVRFAQRPTYWTEDQDSGARHLGGASKLPRPVEASLSEIWQVRLVRVWTWCYWCRII